MVKVFPISLGCAKNLVDTEMMLAALKDAGYVISPHADIADIVLINTCGFIQAAKEEAIEDIFEMTLLKKEGKVGHIIVAGCLSERYKDEIEKELPEVDAFLGTGSYLKVVEACDAVMRGEKYSSFLPKKEHDINCKRELTTPFYTAYIKISEGCSNGCSYCAIPTIRGGLRSRTVESIVSEARELAKSGVKELTLISQDTTSYGVDLYGKQMLPELLDKICEIEGLKWVRVLYCYPERITDELLDVFAKHENLINYFDIPIQHCNAEILKSMRRKGDRASLEALMQKIRAKLPDVILRTTLITGYPGETRAQFNEMVDFIKSVRFDRLGVFAYSREENTIAYSLPSQVSEKEKNRRADIIRAEQEFIADENSRKLIGKTVTVLAEGFDKYAEVFFGRSRYDAPDVDGRIFFTSDKTVNVGEFIDILIEDAEGSDLFGSAI
ncbi:MAG: 30S ribosomal protein S12 methylthiotransferase RimO [Clostridia bacterium]|nr:30S ribosomal protein S12 methylthiotransferase RimO [Clostridia bacterium]